MRIHATVLALAAGLMFGGPAKAGEQNSLAAGSSSSAGSFGAPDTGGAPGGVNPARSGFGFSPFLEEGIAGDVPPGRRRDLRTPAPGYSGDFGRFADP